MRWNIRDAQSGETIEVSNPTTREGRERLTRTIKTHTTVGQSRRFK